MTFDPPPTHADDKYAVFQVVRGSSLHRDAEVLGLVMQRAFKEFPGVPVVVALVDEEVRLDDGKS